MASETNDSTTETTQPLDSWHIVQQSSGQCKIIDQTEFSQITNSPQTWGPFTSRTEAIAKRVGLIRAGQCLPS
ncbi:MAG: hypothetical protein AAGI69_00340 [Cyanobacteria bacterium P01_H01_bin.21]